MCALIDINLEGIHGHDATSSAPIIVILYSIGPLCNRSLCMKDELLENYIDYWRLYNYLIRAKVKEQSIIVVYLKINQDN